MHPGPSRLARDPLQDSDSAEKPPSQPTFVILAIGYGDAPQTSGIGPGLHVPTLIRHFLW